MSSPFVLDNTQRPASVPAARPSLSAAPAPRSSAGDEPSQVVAAADVALLVLEQCTTRCLHHAASWLSELFLSCPSNIADQPVAVAALIVEDPPMPGPARMRLALGQALFARGEFQRCQHHLTASASLRSAGVGGSSSPLPRGHQFFTSSQPPDGDSTAGNEATRYPQISFLALYATYMDGQRIKTISSAKPSSSHNAHLRALRTMLLSALDLFPSDPYLSWLCGVVCRDLGLKQDAAIYLLSAVVVNPFFWSAWEDLGTLISRVSQLDEILAKVRVLQVPLILDIFAASVKADLQLSADACVLWERLHLQVPDSNFIKIQAATSLYYQKEFDTARALYEEARLADPFRLEGIDDFSNTLFVRGDRLALSVLAHDVARIDPYRAESNCVIGNYYAIAQRHDKALLHFRRAVAIDPSYLSAWTLMGHSYLEVKNTSAAVHAYRTAVDIDMRDYRAWYGLGQIYELLQMYHYALYYYWQTTSVRATDPRMWTAVANCLDKQKRTAEAVLCLQRAEEHESPGSEGYPSLVRRIVESLQQVQSGDTAGANDETVLHYLNKMLGATAGCPGVHSPWVRREDVVFALPLLIECHIRVANDALQVPNRSPSCDAAVAATSLSNGGAPRPSAELRKSTAAAAIAAAETYVAMLPQYDVKLSTRQVMADIQTAKVFLAALT
jgi:tetratricopeptide (TPR) repeat protein